MRLIVAGQRLAAVVGWCRCVCVVGVGGGWGGGGTEQGGDN
jgi:hypothetical protein